jgi:clathrin heavy chain
VKFSEVAQLTALGIDQSFMTWNSLTMESDKHVCVRQEAAGSKQVKISIVDLTNPAPPETHGINADSAILNPMTEIIALKAETNSGQVLQIFNLKVKVRMKHHTIADNDKVVFWRWITPATIALVTNTSVYHWGIEGEGKPAKVFDRDEKLSGAHILGYKISPDEKWMSVYGIKKGPTGSVDGCMQLYSKDRSKSNVLEGHCSAFATAKPDGAANPVTVVAFAQKTAQGQSQVQVVEVGGGQNPSFPRVAGAIRWEDPNDFPTSITVSEKHTAIYMLSKMGYVFIYDLLTATPIFQSRISESALFVTANHTDSGGVIGVNRNGQVLQIAIDEANIVNHICNTLNNVELAVKFASRNNLPGAEGLFSRQFDALFSQQRFKEAAQCAAESPMGVLRTAETIRKFQSLPAQGGASPILQYFQTLLEHGKLNALETVELARPAVAQGKLDMLRKWWDADKLEGSEELGDMIRPSDNQWAMKIYIKGKSHSKVVAAFLESGQYDKVILYAQKTDYTPDYITFLRQMVMISQQGALDFALKLAQNEGGSLVDIGQVVDLFMSRNLVQETTSFLLDVLKNNRPEEAAFQTRLLEINLQMAPQVANAIFENDMFSHYDRPHIARLCEQAGLYQRALEHYTELADVKRVIVHTNMIPAEVLIGYFGNLSAEFGLECLKTLLATNPSGNAQICVQIATKYSDALGAANIIPLFEQYNCIQGLFYYLQAVVNFSQEADVHFKYIQAGCKLGQIKEVERITRESSAYDPIEVRDFLMEARLQDQLPLINVCDKHDMVEELVKYLYTNNMLKFIQIYVTDMNPMSAPKVAAALLDADCSEDVIQQIITAVRNRCNGEELVAEVEKRNRLKILKPWLETVISEGNQEVGVHNGLMKVYVDTGNEPEKFLAENLFYNSQDVGVYCEKRDPYLAFICYKRGQCDDELIEVTTKHNLFRHQASYLVERQSSDLWARVLDPENPVRQNLIDQVISTALPATENPDDVSETVRAFMAADLPGQLIELLEKIVIQNSVFSEDPNLQNLLLLTAIKADKTRVMDYINRLDKYDAPDIALIAISADLYEEAFTIYNKFGLHQECIDVIITQMTDLDRAYEYAERIDNPNVWSRLGRAQMQAMNIKGAVESFCKAKDAQDYTNMVEQASAAEAWEELVIYLKMARTDGGLNKEPVVDTELMFALAKNNELSELEELINSPNVAQIQVVGDRCFDAAMYEAAKLLFLNISNYGRLASARVMLGEFQAAVDAAKKAMSPRTWKEVNFACVDAGEFRLAQVCGLHIIVHADELDDLICKYEHGGHFEELIELMEAGTGLERAHMGIYTELGILYAKFKDEKLMNHIKIFGGKINIPKLIRACEEYQHWLELRVLYQKYEEFDNAVMTMIQHTPEAFEHAVFKDIITKVANTEILYKAIKFYLDTVPTEINDLMGTITTRVDHVRVTRLVIKEGHLPMIKDYLQAVQHNNLQAVNDALHDIYVAAGDYESVRKSVETYDNVDLLKLAQELEKHELVEFRRLAAFVYKKKGKHTNSVELSKADGMYRDAMETAAESQSTELCEDLLRFFVEQGRHDCFGASLYTMYDYLLPDVVLELAYRYEMMDFALPYMVQTVREYTTRVIELESKTEKMADKTEDLNQLAPTNTMGYDMGMGQMALMGPGMGAAGGVNMMSGGMNMGGMGGMGGGYGGY